MTFLEKIQAVAMDVMSIDKDMQVGKGSYAYKAVSDLSVTIKVKEAEKKHGIISIPFKQELIKSEILKTINEDGNKERVVYSVYIKMTTRIYDVTDKNEFIDIESFGHGLDSGDKGFGKASTYARKYALLNAYKIATGEDPDKEESEKTSTAKTLSEKRIAVENYLNKNEKSKTDVLKHFNYDKVSDISDNDLDSIFKTFNERKVL